MAQPNPFTPARSGFIKAEDFDGRLVVIEVGEHKKLKSDYPNAEFFDAVVCTVHVLTGEPNDNFEKIPATLEGIQLSGSSLTPQLVHKSGKTYPANVVYGNMFKGHSDRYNRDTMRLREPTPEETDIVTAWANTRNPFDN